MAETMNLKRLGEFGLVRRISDGIELPGGVAGIGDDCAVLPQKDGLSTLVSTDMLIEGVHFLTGAAPYDLGWKSAAVNLSDIAAMGGTPTGTFLAFALPPGVDTEWTDMFINGYKDVSRQFGVPLLGGDTCSSPDRLSICVTVTGECPSGTEVRRSGAGAGELVCVTGTLGDSAAGLRLLMEEKRPDAAASTLVRKHSRPQPRIPEGIGLRQAGVSAMMDISDGLASDLRHILEASGVGARIRVADIPVSEELRKVCGKYGWDPVRLALEGGEDYELLFTVKAEVEAELTIPHRVIGEITAGYGIVWEGAEGRDFSGYTHF